MHAIGLRCLVACISGGHILGIIPVSIKTCRRSVAHEVFVSQVEIVDESPGDVVGMKAIIILVKGDFAYGYARYESGVHRLVRISPFDQAGARHTSFASVRVSPHFEEDDQELSVELRPADLKITTMRSQGAGKQSIHGTELLNLRLSRRPKCEQDGIRWYLLPSSKRISIY